MAFDGKSEHYCAGGMEAMDVIEAYGLNFAIGNAVKYLLRCGRKGDDADALRDLEKAAAYIQREIKRRRTASDLEEQCARYKSENEVRAEIIEKLQNPIRLDKLNEWIRRQPPVYAETYNKMRSRGETVEERSAEKKRGRVVRLATDEERQKADDLDGLAKREAQE